jgi:hypothetical protein
MLRSLQHLSIFIFNQTEQSSTGENSLGFKYTEMTQRTDRLATRRDWPRVLDTKVTSADGKGCQSAVSSRYDEMSVATSSGQKI